MIVEYVRLNLDNVKNNINDSSEELWLISIFKDALTVGYDHLGKTKVTILPNWIYKRW